MLSGILGGTYTASLWGVDTTREKPTRTASTTTVLDGEESAAPGDGSESSANVSPLGTWTLQRERLGEGFKVSRYVEKCEYRRVKEQRTRDLQRRMLVAPKHLNC